MKIFSRIVELLEENHVNYVTKRHAPTLTSLDSARERGEPLKIGAKALLVKTDKEFLLAVLPADRRLNTKALKEINDIIRPTLVNLHSELNHMELQDRIYNKLLPITNQLNVCLVKARDVRDSNYCSDAFLQQLRTEGIPNVKKVLQDY